MAYVVYKCGEASGMQKYALDPDGERRKLVGEQLKSIGALDENGRAKLCKKDSDEVKALKRVFPRILKGAIEEVKSIERKVREEEEAKREQDGAKGGLDNYITQKKLKQLRNSRKQLEHWSPEGFIVADVNTPNAFVTGMIPRLFFVHRGIFHNSGIGSVTDLCKLSAGDDIICEFKKGQQTKIKGAKQLGVGKHLEFAQDCKIAAKFVKKHESKPECFVKVDMTEHGDTRMLYVPNNSIIGKRFSFSTIENDEQLAMLLGHEMAHVVHGHSQESTESMALMIGMQMVILAVLDPTGMLTFLIEMFIGKAVKYGLELPHSRKHEYEADATGLRIAARALYNPRDAAQFFDRMLMLEDVAGRGSSPTWKSTHPRHEDRIQALQKHEANAMEYFRRKLKQAQENGRREPDPHQTIRRSTSVVAVEKADDAIRATACIGMGAVGLYCLLFAWVFIPR